MPSSPAVRRSAPNTKAEHQRAVQNMMSFSMAVAYERKSLTDMRARCFV